ncbi:phosphomannomutase (plasmid) [Rhodospirillum rubrum ATCC 11170]|uniref:Phosphomannomutase n=1 Tax=Rhodospirillum rubrum (strain ATCC 11170 / ATH 1.1.1 / DSM 467 / LMG 4362 / NCIMB 8255 / S1) TaxID=269796 RepID=Q2RMK4_RHORT|nr:phosphomannomutase/phosphoglucomutase [Rhodospirillum rubrum]ABC24641.1 phosphomannomutase [Rhodospirillum rubrum ATCC 11170]QXG82481.1 phosphomannomutase/phosphoglucomutase [Rhodospirillum rubrum]
MHQFHPSILREYDIRGIIGETLSTADARAIGQAFGTMVREEGRETRVCVGRDGRLSSPELEEAVVEGLLASGTAVIRIGLGPTPMLYFAQKTLGTAGAIQITGSHNPPNHNGFKMMKGGKPFFGDGIRALGEMAASGSWASGSATVQTVDVRADYLKALLGGFSAGGKDLTVVWDPGNGAAGDMLQALVARLPGRHVVINAAIDGHFPNHHPDPTDPHTLVQLQEAVASEKAALGIAFDGDGDRLGVVDDRGRILWGDQFMVLLAKEVLAAHPGAPIIADVKASQLLFDQIAAMGGRPVVGRTGHSLIKTLMAEIGSPLAGEMSGHIFFADRYYGFDDALYAATRLLSIVARLPGTLGEWFDTLPRLVNTPELRFECADDAKVGVIETVRARLKKEGAEMSEVDGVRVLRPQGWWLLRASNTQAVLVARAEAKTETDLTILTKDLADYLVDAGLTPPDLMTTPTSHG